MDLREKLAYSLIQRPFYILPGSSENNAGSISKISPTEYLAYRILTGQWPTSNPKVMFVGSGGSAKGYVVIGLLRRFHELGIKFDEYLVTSVLAFLTLYERTGDIYLTEKFALDIPELLKEKSAPRVMKWFDKMTLGYFHDHITSFARLAHLMQSQKYKLPDGGYLKTNNGFVQTAALENRLKEHLGEVPIGETNMRITATDFTNRRLVVLGKDYPEMPAYRAVLIAISLPKIFAFVMHNGNLLADSGGVLNFPLLNQLIDKKTNQKTTLIGPDISTIVAVDLAYEANYENGVPSGGIGGIVEADWIEAGIRNNLMVELLAERNAKQEPRDLVKNGDRRHMRTMLITPETHDIPPGKIGIKIDQRHELIKQGYELGDLAAKDFRRVKRLQFY